MTGRAVSAEAMGSADAAAWLAGQATGSGPPSARLFRAGVACNRPLAAHLFQDILD